MDAEFAAYLKRVRAHRAELRESVAAVDDALATPLLKRAVWTERVHVAIAELAHDFEIHIELTEGERGLYANVRQNSPRLAAAAQRLTDEHVEFRDRLNGLLQAFDDGEPITDLQAFREDVTSLMGSLVRHRQRGTDLVYEAYEVDIGGSG